MKTTHRHWPITLLVVATLAGSESLLHAQAPTYNREAIGPSDTAGRDGRLESALGVLVPWHYGEHDTVRIVNDDGSLWYKFSFYYDDSDGKWDFPNADFAPRAFNPDHFLLTLDVIEANGNQYTVVVNSETGLRKRVKKARFLRFLTWDQYVLTAFAVTFDRIDNPIRVLPDPSARVILFARGTEYQPEAVQGDWLKVKWGRERAEHHGWIRWKSGGRLLVTMYPYA